MHGKDTVKNIFVIGLDDFNFENLKRIKGAENYRFHRLFYITELQGRNVLTVEVALEKGDEALDRFDGSIDAIIGYWDFPVTDMVPLLCRKRGLPSASFESVLKCEHKYWCRVEQRKVVPEHVPPFRDVDPFDDESVRSIDLACPYWIKPVKATDSQLAYRIGQREDLAPAIGRIRKGIHTFAGPFNHLLEKADLPDEIARVDGRHCLVEGTVSGHQCTTEGYVHKGEPHVHGVIDSFRYPGVSSFFRYQYPSRLPVRVQNKLVELSKKVISQIGLDQSTFNIEFFVDKTGKKISILEVNPRVSQSHSDMFEKVDGASNYQIMVPVALGNAPDFPHRQGQFKCASKFYLRVFADARVTRAPTEEEIERVRERFPETRVRVFVREGDRLSDLTGQDSYSYVVGQVYMGARDTSDLLRRFRECRDMLPFEFEEEHVLVAPFRGKRVEELARNWR